MTVAAFGAAGLLLHCSSSQERSGFDGSTSSGGGPPRDSVNVDILGSGAGGGSADALNPLCGGDKSSCVPDDADACAGYAGGPGLGGAGNGAAGAHSAAGAAGYGVSLPTDSGSLGPSGFACHVGRDGKEITRSCQPAGNGQVDAPCLSSADCSGGLVCVGEGASGLCRPYCCRGVEKSCGDGFYCAPRRVVGAPEPLEAPVCVRADQCSLTESYPCPEGVSCQCTGGTACVIVRADGTTSCVPPGKRTVGQSCDGPLSCAWGHVCSHAKGCLELCSTVSNKNECGGSGYCLGRFAGNVGVCIDLDEQTGATK